MKNILQILSHFIVFLILGALCYFGTSTFTFDSTLFLMYGICFLLCPVLGLCRLSPFTRVLFYIFSIFGLCGGVFMVRELAGEAAALGLLSISAVLFGALFNFFSLPDATPETTHLQLRGIKESHARRKILLRQSYAFFFQKSGVIFGMLSVYQLLLMPMEKNALWSASILTALVSFFGHLFYLMLAAPIPKRLPATAKKWKLSMISLLFFILLLISIYVYVGSLYTSPDPALQSALASVKEILTPAYSSVLVALVPGMLFGLFLSLLGARFFKTVFTGARLLPTALFSGILYSLLTEVIPHAFLFSICIPLFLLGMLGTLESRIRLFPYRDYPISDRKKILLRPLFHLPNLALIPEFFATGVFSSLFLHLTTGGTLYTLSSLSQTLAALILGVILCILFVLCILTKEVRSVG